MTHRIFLGLSCLLILAAVFDRVATGGEGLLFLARGFVNLVDWVAFWR